MRNVWMECGPKYCGRCTVSAECAALVLPSDPRKEKSMCEPKSVCVNNTGQVLTPASKKGYLVYADGACRGNGRTDGGHGGVGLVFVKPDGTALEFSKGYECTTNNRMELMAVLGAIKGLSAGTHTVYMDSAYVVNGINQWMAGWKKRGWKKADGKTVVNEDLWKLIDQRLAEHPGSIVFVWVKGHENNVHHNRADELAAAAADAVKYASQSPDTSTLA